MCFDFPFRKVQPDAVNHANAAAFTLMPTLEKDSSALTEIETIEL